MQLFERVRAIANEIAGSQTKLALALGLKQETFCGYLKETRQDNLWPILPRILEIYPDISREWLYFNEGAMVAGGQKAVYLSKEAESPLAAALAEIVRLNQENRELRAKLYEMEGR